MSTEQVATDIVKLCQAGKFAEAGEKYWADEVVSLEPQGGPMQETRGKDAVRGKSEWWENNHEIHSAQAEGPYINGDQFTVRFTMDMTDKQTGKRQTVQEIGLYTIKNDKIVEERFFYGG